MDKKNKVFEELINIIFNLPNEIKALKDEIRKKNTTSNSSINLIDTKQLCEKLNITQQTANNWRKNNKIPFLQIDGVVRYNLDEVINALKGLNFKNKGNRYGK